MEHLHTAIILLFLFCSPWQSAGTTFLTHLGTPCVEDCKPDGGEYKCKTADKDGRSQTMFCSPQKNMDYWGRQCRADSECGKHGEEDYTWCRISVFSWGYCGLVKDDKKVNESGEGTRINSRHRNKRVPEAKVVLTEDDKESRTKTTFSEQDTNDIANAPTKKMREEAADLINRWNGGKLRDKSGTMMNSDNLRIDMQGRIPRNNLHYYNLQIQINMKRKPGESTTISQVIVPDGVPDHYIRRAFQMSLEHRARVFIDVARY